MDTRTQAIVDSLSDQRNQGLNACALMAGEIADLREQLAAATQMIASLSEEKKALDEAVQKLAPKIEQPQQNT